MLRGAVSAMALLPCLGGSLHAACRFDPAHFYIGFESPIRGEADSGKPCGFGSMAMYGARDSSFRVAQPPRHGVAGIGDSSGMPVVGYRSAAGYRGPDEFIVSFVAGGPRTPDLESTIHVYLDVK
jgi:hypothetical protein